MGTPGHKHEWYAISLDEATRKPALYACAVYWSCIATSMPEYKGRGRNRVLVHPEPVVQPPTRGLWALTDKEPALDAADKRKRTAQARAAVPRLHETGSRGRGPKQDRHRDPQQASRSQPNVTPHDRGPEGPDDGVHEQLPSLHPWD